MGIRNFLFGWRSLGIRRSDLMLEVGSGNRPCARSDVLCDFSDSDDGTRYGGNMPVAAVKDRPFIYADACRLPFRDAAFDFLYSAHMLEHLSAPALFLEEARRVSRRGCIVTPSPAFETLFGEPTHLWYVSVADGTLTLRAKLPEDQGAFGRRMAEFWDESRCFRKLVWTRTDVFETRYVFDLSAFRYVVEGTPRVPPCERKRDHEESESAHHRLAGFVRSVLGAAMRAVFAGRRVALEELLACIACRGPVRRDAAVGLRCLRCAATYAVAPDGSPIMLPGMPRVPDGGIPHAAG